MAARMILALASTLALATSATAQTSEIVSDGGRYLVTLSYLELCSPRALDLELDWLYAEASWEPRLDRDEAVVAVKGPVFDNLIRPAVCRSGISSGTILVEAAAETELKASATAEDLPDATIAVERIEAVKSVAVKAAGTRIGKGEYVVTVEGFDGCNGNRAINLTRKLEYNFGVGQVDKVLLAAGSYVGDNWIRPAVCVSGPITGKAVVSVSKKTLVTPPAGFKVVKMERITAKSEL